MHVPRGLAKHQRISVDWPTEPGSAVNFVEYTWQGWHGTTLAALASIVQDGFLRDYQSEGGFGVFMASGIEGCMYYTGESHPRVVLEVDVPDPTWYQQCRISTKRRTKGKTQWPYHEQDARIKRVHFIGNPECEDTGGDVLFTVPCWPKDRE